MSARARWTFLEQFRWTAPPPPARRWEPLQAWVQTARRALEQALSGLPQRVRQSDEVLERLGGEPLRRDWHGFRPLALGREEDWSDWLAFLLEGSRTGLLGQSLFGGEPAAYAQPASMRREWCLPDGYRADLGIELRSGEWLHVEVKVGDTAFAKTFGTGAAMRRELPAGARARDFVLLPAEDLPGWEESAQTLRGQFPFAVTPILWQHVAVGLRRTLVHGGEPPFWEAWASGFLGCVEQILLGHPRLHGALHVARQPLAQLAALASLDSVLTASLGAAHA